MMCVCLCRRVNGDSSGTFFPGLTSSFTLVTKMVSSGGSKGSIDKCTLKELLFTEINIFVMILQKKKARNINSEQAG